MRNITITVTTTGSDGSATGTGYSAHPLNGRVYALYVDWSASAPAGTSDITITSEDSNPTWTYYSKSNSVTDVAVYPVVQCTDNGATAVSGTYQHYPINSRMKVAVAGCNALTTAVTVYVWILED